MLRASLIALCLSLLPAVAYAVPLALPGFPLKVEGPVRESVTLADLDKDSSPELIVLHGTKITVANSDARTRPGWPVDLAPIVNKSSMLFTGPAAAGDLDGDGTPEIVLAITYGLESDGAIVVLSPNGQLRFQIPVPKSPASGCTLVELTKPGVFDIVVGTRGGKLLALNGKGAPLAGFPVSLGAPASSPVAAAPLVNGQRPALAVGATDGKVYVYSSAGQPMPGFPLVTHFAVSGAPAFGDIDDDGQFELVVASQDFGVHVVKANGTPVTGFPVSAQYRLYSGPALGDLNQDGRLDIVVGAADGKIYAWNHRGQLYPGFPVSAGARLDRTSSIVLADFLRTGRDAILVTAADGSLSAFDVNGKRLEGFPIQLGEGASTPVLGDVVRDDPLELIVGAPGEVRGYRLDLVGTQPPGPLSWPAPSHDSTRQSRVFPNQPRYRNVALSTMTPRRGEPLRVLYEFVSLDGTPEPATQIRWTLNGKSVPELNDRREVPGDRLNRGERWQVSVEPPVSALLPARRTEIPRLVSGEVAVQNIPPSEPKIRIEPSQLFATSAPKVTITSPSSDLDGDAITYLYRWDRDGKTVSTAAALGPASLKKGERWTVLVTPTDGEANGPPAQAEFSVANTSPTTPELRWSKPSFTVEDDVAVELAKPSTDVDNDTLTYRYLFFVNGQRQLVPSTRPSLPAGTARRGDVVRVEVWSNDGEVDSAHTSIETTLTNAAPKAFAVAITPASPVKGSALVAGVTTASLDADHDLVQYRVRWSRNGQPWGAAGQLAVPASETKKGDQWEVEFVPFDSHVTGPAARAAVTVGNSPPSKPRITASNFRPTVDESSTLSIAEEAKDPDGDPLRYVITWEVGGEPAFLNQGSAAPSPAGGSTPTHATTADIARPDKTLPVLPGVPKVKGAKSEVVPAVASEVEPLRLSQRGQIEGKTTLNVGEVRKGKRIVASVVALDADGARSEPALLEIEPGNTPPTSPTVAIEPAQPTVRSGLRAVIAIPSTDRDQDRLSYHFTWYRDGVRAVEVGDDPVITPDKVKRGEEWRVVVTATDGEGESPPAEIRVTVLNAPPLVPSILLSPAAPTAVTGMKCAVTKPATDADGDPLVLEYRWTRNGQLFAATPSTSEIAGHLVRPGEFWQCDVNAFDGHVRSPVVSASAAVVNALPPGPQLAIEPRDVKTANPVKCVVQGQAPDPDGDTLTYDFRWEPPAGMTLPKLDEPNALPAGLVRRGQSWHCVVTVSDGKGASSPVRAEVKVGNLPPNPPTLTLNPDTPTPGRDLHCSLSKASIDPDGDQVNYAFSWYRNGALQPFGPTSAEVPGRLVKPGDRWSCSVVATDGTDSAAPARSGEVTVSVEKRP
jgi:hypothetical protein